MEEPRQPALDGLRGIAILAVVVRHFSALLPAKFGPPILNYELTYGWAGVDLFFALSGFLITRILLQTRNRRGYLTSFWMRRALRILPLYFVTLAVTLVVGEHIPALHVVMPPDRDRLLYFVFLTNWASLWHPWTPNILGHLWSVAIEEQFYLIWPFCVLLLSRRQLSVLAVALACGMLLLRVSYIAEFGSADFISLVTITRADGLALGGLAAVLISKGVSGRDVRFASIGSIAALELFWVGTLVYRAHPIEFYQTAGFSLLGFGFAAGVFAIAAANSRTPIIRALETRWLTNVGKYSFGIYLFHVPLLEAFGRLVVLRIWTLWNTNAPLVVVGIATLWAVTYYLAKFSFDTFEAPLMRLKRYTQPGTQLPSAAPRRA